MGLDKVGGFGRVLLPSFALWLSVGCGNGHEFGGGSGAGGSRASSNEPADNAGESSFGGEQASGACVNDALRCTNNSTPSKCVAHAWVDQAVCEAPSPACNNGVCAAARLTGGLITLTDGVLSTGEIHLAEHGLEYAPLMCGMISDQKICVTGGIRP